MRGKIFWAGFTAISLVCGFTFSLLTGTLVVFVAGTAWWWVVYRSGYFS